MLALTSPTGGGRSVGIVRVRTKATEFSLVLAWKKEIQRRILASNRTYFAAISLFRSRLLSRATKLCYIRH